MFYSKSFPNQQLDIFFLRAFDTCCSSYPYLFILLYHLPITQKSFLKDHKRENEPMLLEQWLKERGLRIRNGYEGKFQGVGNVLFLDLEAGYMMLFFNIHKLYTLHYNFLYMYFKTV